VVAEATMLGVANPKGERNSVDAVTAIPQTDAKISFLIVNVDTAKREIDSQIARSATKFKGY